MSTERISVGSASAGPGEVGQGYLQVGALTMDTELKIPVMVINGQAEGPVLWLNGAVHGDELNAFMVMRNLAKTLDPAKLTGAVVCTPLCNPLSVQWRNKINPYDFLDLDQQFPGQAGGTYSQRVAHCLFQEISRLATHVINFHTVGTSFAADPYTVYKYAPGMDEARRSEVEALALAFGTHANCRVDLGGATSEIPGGVGGALDINCSQAGIPAFMAEIGSGGRFQEDAIAAGENGVRGVMKHLGMLDGHPDASRDQIIITKRAFLYSDYPGFLASGAEPSTVVAKGEALGTVVNFFEDLGEMAAPEDAFVIMIRKEPAVHVGDRIAFLGLEWTPAR